jgi:hypothetical protein
MYGKPLLQRATGMWQPLNWLVLMLDATWSGHVRD